MPSHSSAKRRHTEASDYGFARARDLAFDAIKDLWKVRHKAGMKQSDIAAILGKEPAWVSRQLSGPGNWTLRTVGELCEALGGELSIQALPVEEPENPAENYHAYSGYGTGAYAPHSDTKVFYFRHSPASTSSSKVLEVTK